MGSKSSPKRVVKGTPQTVFDSIRKPVAPPGHPLSRAKPDEVARPAGRKAKHKQRPPNSMDDDG